MSKSEPESKGGSVGRGDGRMDGGFASDYEAAKGRISPGLRRRVPTKLKDSLSRWYWRRVDALDYVSELVGGIPSHSIRRFLYRWVCHVTLGSATSIHRNCRFYRPAGVRIGAHTVINRDVLLDGRMGLEIGENVSVSEGVAIFTLAHDPNSPTFENRGAPVRIGDCVFIGARAILLPGVSIGGGAVVAAGSVVTRDVEPFTIVAGVPARPIGQRRQDLTYSLDYRKFLG